MSFPQLALRNVLRNHRAYLGYFLSSAFSVLVLFMFLANLFHPQIGSQFGSGPVRIILTAGGVALYAFSALFVLYSIVTFLKNRSRELGLLTILGASRLQLSWLLFLENVVIGAASILAGVGIGLALSQPCFTFAAYLLGLERLSHYFPERAALLTAAGFAAIFVAVAILAPLFVSSRQAIELLKGVRKPRPEPKASAWLVGLGLVSLLGGYLLALLTVAIPYEVYVIGLLVALGTYLFYTQVSVFGLKRLKSRSSFFYRGLNLLWISDLVYRLKDNARLLFIVTMVSAAAFTAMASSYALSQTLYEEFSASSPFAFNYFSSADNVDEARHTEIIERSLREEGFAFTRASAPLLVKQTGRGWRMMAILPESGYGEIAEALGRPRLQLGDGEAALVSPWVEKANTRIVPEERTVSLGGTELTVAQVVSRNIFPEGSFTSLFVVSDATFRRIAPEFRAFRYYGYRVPDWARAAGVSEKIRDHIPEGQAQYILRESPSWYRLQRFTYRLIFFVCGFMSLVFFAAAGSFLYFRFYTDLQLERAKFRALQRIGLSDDEVRRTASVQLGVLFFVPYVVAAVHTAFALYTLQGFVGTSLTRYVITVLACALAAQLLYFAVLRSRYLRGLLQAPARAA